MSALSTMSAAPGYAGGPLRICLIASCRHPIAEPFAGGLESMTHALATELAARGHEVTLFAGPGSDAGPDVELMTLATTRLSRRSLADRNAPDEQWMADHHAYLDLMLRLSRGEGGFDVVHNNSLHHLPVAMASAVPVPILTTLHTPPLPWLESALALAPHGTPGSSSFVAVSAHTAEAWAHVVASEVVPNGVDLQRWRVGPGGGPAVWFGRLVAEKAPHEAIEACRRAGVPLVLAGPAHDTAYVEAEVLPRLGGGAAWVGHLPHDQLRDLISLASVAVVTPGWDEPYGLVAAEAMACGTPVAAYDRGGLGDVVGGRLADGGGGGVLARAGDVDDLAVAVRMARRIDRAAVRRHAELSCSLQVMVDAYEGLYAELCRAGRAA